MSSWLSVSPYSWVIVDERGVKCHCSERAFRDPLIAWNAGVAELDGLTEPHPAN
jgi:hypothetical protein